MSDSRAVGRSAEPDRVALRKLIVEMGGAMVAAGDAVDVVEDSLRRILDAFGVGDVQIALLPTSMFVQTGAGETARVEFTSHVAPPLRLDQISELYELVKLLENKAISPAEGLHRLRRVYRLRPTFGWPLRTLGHAILTAGLALLLQPTFRGLVAALVLGLFVGLLKLRELSTLRLIFPVVASFATAVLVFLAARQLQIGSPVRLLVAPLVTFLPGGTLAVATMEIAAGQMVSGATRLITGLVQLALLAFGILAAGALVGESQGYLRADHVPGLGPWMAWLGVFIFAAGVYLHFSAPLRSLPWMLLVLLAAFGAQEAASALFGGELSGFFGAVTMTLLVLWVEKLPNGPPKLVTFLPAFWLLVPGATGLIGLTQMIGTGNDIAANVFRTALVSIISISLGVLIGAALHQTAQAGAHRVAKALRPTRTP